jgi:hypothetical protein
MANLNDAYSTTENHIASDKMLRFYFVSRGKRDILKVVEYQFLGEMKKSRWFNLGFGDHDPQTGAILDEQVSANNDHYKVFHTVLSTIPGLFAKYRDASLWIQGSDSTPEYIARCKETCSRNCINGNCRKAYRRINIYRNFIDKNLEQFDNEYIFKGRIGDEDLLQMETYRKGEKYNALLVSRK